CGRAGRTSDSDVDDIRMVETEVAWARAGDLGVQARRVEPRVRRPGQARIVHAAIVDDGSLDREAERVERVVVRAGGLRERALKAVARTVVVAGGGRVVLADPPVLLEARARRRHVPSSRPGPGQAL